MTRLVGLLAALGAAGLVSIATGHAEKEFLISGRGNFANPLPSVVPTIEALKTIPVDWSAVSTEEMQKFREEWTGLFKKKE